MESQNSGSSTSKHSQKFQNKLACIHYPGIVENVDKMIETLGGMDNIELAVGEPLKKLELKFRPGNLTSKSTIADKDTKPGILLKVKVPNSPQVSQDDDEETKLNGGYKYEVEGITALTFKFNRLFDYQYVPLVTKDKDETETKESKLEYIYNKILPDELPNIDWFTSEESKNLTQFLLPAFFTRLDSTQNKLHFPRAKFYENQFSADYAQRLKMSKTPQPSASKFIPVPRRNKSYCKSVTIADKQIPMEPFRSSMIALSSKYVNEKDYEKLKKMFEERPVWSRSACQHILGVNSIQIRMLLSLVGYYFLTGPWRIMWVRYGYDPRLDPESRKYQTFDFRIRTSGGLKLRVQAKRNYTKGERHSKKVSLKQDTITKQSRGELDESDYILRPNMIPPARQMFYQYCDVQIPEIQTMLTRLPPVLPGTKCDEKNGWLPSSFTDQCREIANRYVTEHVQTLLDQQREEEKSEPGKKPDYKELELCEISDSDEDSQNEAFDRVTDAARSNSSDDEDSKIENLLKEGEDEIDLEAVEEVNKILGFQKKSQD